MFKTKTLGKR